MLKSIMEKVQQLQRDTEDAIKQTNIERYACCCIILCSDLLTIV